MVGKRTGEPVGRPSKMTPEAIAKLEFAFCKGFTDQQASDYVSIDISTLYDYCKKHPEFSHKKEKLKRTPNLTAKINLVEAMDNEDMTIKMNSSRFWAERKMKDEFSLRVENTGKDGKDLIPDRIIRDDIKPNLIKE